MKKNFLRREQQNERIEPAFSMVLEFHKRLISLFIVRGACRGVNGK